MKLFRIISHPYTLIICFLMIMISGEHWGGFYALYLLMALPFGGIHSFLAIGGIIILLISYHRLKTRNIMALVFNLAGVLFLFGSLFYFFDQDTEHYNWATFKQIIPLITLSTTILVALLFLIGSFIRVPSKKALAA